MAEKDPPAIAVFIHQDATATTECRVVTGIGIAAYGEILSDLIDHIVTMYVQEGGFDPIECKRQILEAFNLRNARKTPEPSCSRSH